MNRSLIHSKAGLLAAAAMATALATGCHHHPGGLQGAAATATSLVPKDVDAVISINLQTLRGTKLWGDIVKQVESQPDNQLAKMKKDCGIDPLQDFDDILVGLNAAKSSEQDFVAIVSGTHLGEKQVMDCMKKEQPDSFNAMTKSQYGGKTIYERSGSQNMSMVFLDDKTLALAGNDAWAKQVVDLSAGKGDSLAKNDALMDLVKKTRTKSAQIWGAVLVPDSIKEQIGDVGAKLKAVYGSVDVTSGLDADVNAQATSEADAKAMYAQASKALDQGKPMLQAMGLDNAVKLSQNGDTLKIAVNMSQQDLDKVTSLLKQQLGGMMGGGEEEAPSSQP